MLYQPFLDDPSHIKALDRQRYVVLRAPLALSAAYTQVQEILRERLRGQPVSYPQSHWRLGTTNCRGYSMRIVSPCFGCTQRLLHSGTRSPDW